MFKKKAFKEFAFYAASLTKVNMAIDDPPNASLYKARADKYEGWAKALYEAEGKKGWLQRLWQ